MFRVLFVAFIAIIEVVSASTATITFKERIHSVEQPPVGKAESDDFGPLNLRIYVPLGMVDDYSGEVEHPHIIILDYFGEWIGLRPITGMDDPGVELYMIGRIDSQKTDFLGFMAMVLGLKGKGFSLKGYQTTLYGEWAHELRVSLNALFYSPGTVRSLPGVSQMQIYLTKGSVVDRTIQVEMEYGWRLKWRHCHRRLAQMGRSLFRPWSQLKSHFPR